MNGWSKKKIRWRTNEKKNWNDPNVVYLNDCWRNIRFLKLKNILRDACLMKEETVRHRWKLQNKK